MIQSKNEGLGTRGASGVNPSPRVGEDEGRRPSSAVREKDKGHGFLLPLPILARSSMDG